MEFENLSSLATIIMGQSPKKEEVNRYRKGLPLLNGPTEFGKYCPIPVQFTEYPKKVAPKGSLLFCVRGSTTGRMNWADQDYAIGRGLATIIPNDIRMGEYLRNSINYNLEYLLSSATGSTFPNVSANLLGSFPVQIVRSTVGASNILDVISKKKLVNQHLISNLEQLAQILFKRWFVDFEFPDENGEPYKSSGGELVESKLGMIPVDWELVKLNEIITHSKKTFNPKTTDTVEVAHFSLPAFDRQEYPLIEKSESIKSNKYYIDKNSLMFSKMNPTTPRIWLPNILRDIENVCSSEFVVLDTSLNNNKAFIYALIKSESFTRFLIKNASGSTNSRQRVIPTNAISYLFPYNRDTSLVFDDLVQSLYDKILVLREVNQSLVSLRDTLLPKLFSGEIELPEETEVNEYVPIS